MHYDEAGLDLPDSFRWSRIVVRIRAKSGPFHKVASGFEN